VFVVDVDSEYVISLLAFNHNGDGEATASTVRTSPASGRTLLLSLPSQPGSWREAEDHNNPE